MISSTPPTQDTTTPDKVQKNSLSGYMLDASTPFQKGVTPKSFVFPIQYSSHTIILFLLRKNVLHKIVHITTTNKSKKAKKSKKSTKQNPTHNKQIHIAKITKIHTLSQFILLRTVLMHITLTPWNQSNYEITLTVPTDSMDSYKEKTLKNFQKDITAPWFRKGHVPLDMVEKKITPQYLAMGIFEEIVHQGTKKLLDENKDIRFIGSIYDLNRSEKDDTMIVTFKLDIFPEVAVTNSNRKTVTLKPVDATVTQEEIDQTLTNLKRQYAEYTPSEAVQADSIFKVKFVFLDDAGEEIDKGTAYIAPEDVAEFPILTTIFTGKKNEETFTTDYNHDQLPHVLHSHNASKPAKTITWTVSDIRTMILPELTPENIKKFFGNESMTTMEELTNEIKTLLGNQKHETLMMQNVDEYLQNIMTSFSVAIPQTLVEEELKSRMKNLEERMWGADGLKKYYERIGEEKTNAMKTEIKEAASTSLTKFFVLKALAAELSIAEADLDRQTPLAVEKRIYDALITTA
jgi:trigger factor